MYIKFVAQVLEKVIFGSLIMEPAEPSAVLSFFPPTRKDSYRENLHW